MNVTAIILAAGASKRLGTPKQLLRFEGESLLYRTTCAALGSCCDNVIVVTGAAAEACSAEVSHLPVRIQFNARWPQGLASSIQAGMVAIAEQARLPDCVVLAVCDQPHLDSALIDRLIEMHVSAKRGIVASQYAGTSGVPALFALNYYTVLAALGGDRGARELFAKFSNDLANVPFPLGAVDIDTAADLHALNASTVPVCG